MCVSVCACAHLLSISPSGLNTPAVSTHTMGCSLVCCVSESHGLNSYVACSVNWRCNIGPGVPPGSWLFLCAVSAQRTRPLLGRRGRQTAWSGFRQNHVFQWQLTIKRTMSDVIFFFFWSQRSTGQHQPSDGCHKSEYKWYFSFLFFFDRIHSDPERSCSVVNNETSKPRRKQLD